MKSEKQLYQWDVNQYLTELQPEAQFVDYPMGNEVIRIETDGKRCRIPDEFLQTAGFKTCYERYSDGTYKAYNFNVQSSPKPPDYVYTADERTTFEALVKKADAAIEEIKRRADSGEFTPVKGVDYFTEEEKNELMESVSDGAIGEFRKVVDTATTEYNDNHNLQLAKYNANASEKLTTYDTNAEQHTTDYNRNAEVKLEAYNQNHTEKVAEYNQNAAALQTEVDRLRGECDTLAAENRKQENRISALMKLNKGQTYDILPEEGEAASRTAPSGAKYVSVDNVGGKSVVWNQLLDYTKAPNVKNSNGITYRNNMDGTFTATGTVDANTYSYLSIPVHLVAKHIYLSTSTQPGNVGTSHLTGEPIESKVIDSGYGALTRTKATGIAHMAVQFYEAGQTAAGEIAKPQLYDLTQMFGAGNEPTIEQFKKMFAQRIYPYNSGEIISSTTANVELEGKNLWDDTDPAFTQVLTKVRFTFDGTTWKSNLIDYIKTPITIAGGSTFSYDIKAPKGINARMKFTMNSGTSILYKPNYSDGSWKHHSLYLPNDVHTIYVDFTKAGPCEIKNIQLERGTTETAYSPHTKQSLSTGFSELHSAGTAHDEIDMDGGQVIRNVYTVNLETLQWQKNADNRFVANLPAQAKAAGTFNDKNNELCNTYESKTMNELFAGEKGIATHSTTGEKVWIYDNAYETPEQLVASLSGAVLQYELETPTTEPVTIPEALQEWLPVEAGGTVTFRNADESKQLAVPNAVSWVRKLDEVE